ncbi:MAG: AMP-binding protein [Thermodesulfovibrionales bacterium]|nr:AMP-binding protein [Thermodesulfovibrionales bacterium]
MHNTIPSLFQLSVEKNRDRIAFNYFDGEWRAMSYGEFSAIINNVASLLIGKGLNKGDRAAIVSENRTEWCASYMAIVMCGGIAVPIDMQLGKEEIKNLLIDSEANVVFYSSRTETNVLQAIEGSSIMGINFDTHLFATSHFHPFTYSPVSSDDIASIIYTSGTTGKPKGVMLTHKNFCSDAMAVIQAEVVAHDDNVLSILPLHHTYPFMCTFIVPLLLGAAVTFSPGLKAVELMSAIKDKGVTVVVSVPRILEMIRDGIVLKMKGLKISWLLFFMMRLCGLLRSGLDINFGIVIFKSVHRNFKTLRFFASGGARLEPQVMKDLEALGFTVLEGYGLTETSPVITFNPAQRRKPGSAGKPLIGAEIKISDDGEITVKGPMVMKGYYKNPSETDNAIRNGWFFTGDTGHVDHEGYLFITGRKKEVIVLSSGKNIYPEDVEKVYLVIPIIKELCVLGIEKNGIIDSLHAVIVPDHEYAKKALIGNISEALKWEINEVSMRLPEYMRVRGYTLYSEPLPRTPLGKLRRFMIRELVSRRWDEIKSRAQDRGLIEDEVGRRVAECILLLMKEKVYIQSSDNLELDLGFDSLKRVELLSSLESAFSISLPGTFISEVQTVQDVVSGIKKHFGGKSVGGAGRVQWKEILEKEPLIEDLKKVGLSFSGLEIAIARILFLLQKALLKVFFRFKVYGRENIPEGVPFVITPNHVSYLDGFVVATSLPFRIFKNLYFLGFQKYFSGLITSWFARISHVIPIDAETYLHKALQMSAYVLKNKKAMCIFPEGGRSFDGKIMEFKKGIGVLALELDVQIVPAFISGTYEALPRGARFFRTSKIEVIFGKPLKPSDVDMAGKPEGIDEYQFFSDALKDKVVAEALKLQGMLK